MSHGDDARERPDDEPAEEGAALLPDPQTFLSGHTGHVAGVRRVLARRAGDALLDARLLLTGSGRRLDGLGVAAPDRELLVIGIYRPGGRLIENAIAELRSTRHRLRIVLGSTGEAVPALAGETRATGLGGGKFQNLNALLEVTAGPEADWLVVMDDDVELPRRFLDRLIGVCESEDLALAQPAQTLASHAAWPLTRRRAGVLARPSRFVEIGPVTVFRRDAAAVLTPFPGLRFGWGLDLHWAAIADEHGWRRAIVDSLPVRHEVAPVASGYPTEEAIDEARRFLAGRPYVSARELGGGG